MTQHRELVQQMLATLEAANAIIYEEFCGTTCPELHTCDETILAARAYLAAPEQKTWQIWCDTCEGGGTVDNTLGGDNTNATSHDDCPDCNGRGFNNRHAPQPTTPEPVNQMLLAALKEIDNWLVCWCIATPEDMAQSFGHMEQVASAAIAAAEQAPQPELTDEQIRAIVYDTRYNGIYDTVRACIAAAQKGTK